MDWDVRKKGKEKKKKTIHKTINEERRASDSRVRYSVGEKACFLGLENGKNKMEKRRLRQMEGNHRAFRRKPEKRIRFRVDVQPVIAFTSSLPSRRVNIRLAASKFPVVSARQEAFPPVADRALSSTRSGRNRMRNRICSKYSPIFTPEISLSFQFSN